MRRNSQQPSPNNDPSGGEITTMLNLRSLTTLSISPLNSNNNVSQSRSTTTTTTTTEDELSLGHHIVVPVAARPKKKKPYLKKTTNNNHNNNNTGINELRRIDSIQFGKKALHTKNDSSSMSTVQSQQHLPASTFDDDYFYYRSRLIHPNLVRKAVSSSTRRPPLRCLLDSGELTSASGNLSAAEDHSTNRFQAFVLAENFTRRRDFFTMFDRNADEEFPIRQKEIYNRFRSGVDRRKRDLPSSTTASSIQPPPEFQLTTSTTNTKLL